MDKSHRRSIEETPLLFLFLEDTLPSPRRRRGFGWTGEQGSSRCFGIFLFCVFLLTFMAVIAAHTFFVAQYSPACPPLGINETQVYIVHQGGWDTLDFQAIEDIITNYPGLPVQLLHVQNVSEDVTSNIPMMLDYDDNDDASSIIITRVKRHLVPSELDVNFPKYVIVKRIDSVKELLRQYPVIVYNEQPISAIYNNTPFAEIWPTFSMDMVDLTARLLSLWQSGGISIKLVDIDDVTPESEDISNMNGGWRIDRIVRGNLTTFLEMPEGVVNIDGAALHMETKTPCHAFFGELIRNIRNHIGCSVESALNHTLKSFCGNGVEANFCSDLL